MWPVERLGQAKFTRIRKEWGEEVVLHNGERFCAKVLRLDPGKRSSLHFHSIKDELFYVMSGRCWIEYQGKTSEYIAGQSLLIEAGAPHRFWNDYENSICDIFEASTHHDDNDVVRLSKSGSLPR